MALGLIALCQPRLLNTFLLTHRLYRLSCIHIDSDGQELSVASPMIESALRSIALPGRKQHNTNVW